MWKWRAPAVRPYEDPHPYPPHSYPDQGLALFYRDKPVIMSEDASGYFSGLVVTQENAALIADALNAAGVVPTV